MFALSHTGSATSNIPSQYRQLDKLKQLIYYKDSDLGVYLDPKPQEQSSTQPH